MSIALARSGSLWLALARSGSLWLAFGLISAICHVALAQDGRKNADRFTTGGVVVKFARGIGPESPEWRAAELITMGRQYYRYRSVPSMMTLAVPPGTEDDAVFWLRQLPGVERASRHAQGELADCPDPSWFPVDDDLLFPEQWWLYNCGQTVNGTSGMFGADINMIDGWTIQTDGSGIVVAVVDSGVYYLHPDLKDNMWVNSGEDGGDKRTNGIDDDANGWIDDVHGINDFTDDMCGDQPNEGDPIPTDNTMHGTRVAAQIAADPYYAPNNGYNGLVGVAHAAQIMAIRRAPQWPGCDPPPVDGFVIGLDYAISMGADVINCSWVFFEDDAALHELCGEALTNEIVLVVAAGNSGLDLDSAASPPPAPPPFALYPQNYTFDNIIVVAALDQNGCLAAYSNYGNVSVDLAAPGSNVIVPQPWIPTSQYPQHPEFSYPIPPGLLQYDSGTSFAAPLVTGVIALLWTKEPSLTYQQVISRVVTTGDVVCDLQGNTVSGRRLNAYRVLANEPDTGSCTSTCP